MKKAMSIVLMLTGAGLFLTGFILYLNHHRFESTTKHQINLDHVIQTAVADGTLSNKEKALIRELAAQGGETPEQAVKKAERLLAVQNEKAETEVIDYNKKNGLDFEKFVATNFDPLYFKITKWAGDKYAGGVYSSENLDPDIQLKITLGSKSADLAVECKWRRSAYKNKVQISGPEQLQRYKKFAKDRKMPVFIALGLGGTGEQPNDLFVIPVESLHSETVNLDEIRGFKKNPERKFFYDFETQLLK
jgi:hypothetical protein